MGKVKASAKNLSGSIPPDDASLFPTDKKIVLTEKKMDSILRVSKGKARVKTVSTPFAQYAIQCEATTGRGWDAKTLSDKYQHIKSYDPKVAVIFDLQFAGGCRISEVLAISASDIDSLGKVTIHSLKGGVNRIVQSSFSAQWLTDYKKKGVSPFIGIDRFYVYRAYKKFGISEYYGENKRASVTHLPRHEVALASKEAKREETITQSQLGQKSVKSTAHYTGKGRGKKAK